MDKEIKICPRCEQGYLYHAKPKYFYRRSFYAMNVMLCGLGI